MDKGILSSGVPYIPGGRERNAHGQDTHTSTRCRAISHNIGRFMERPLPDRGLTAVPPLR